VRFKPPNNPTIEEHNSSQSERTRPYSQKPRASQQESMKRAHAEIPYQYTQQPQVSTFKTPGQVNIFNYLSNHFKTYLVLPQQMKSVQDLPQSAFPKINADTIKIKGNVEAGPPPKQRKMKNEVVNILKKFSNNITRLIIYFIILFSEVMRAKSYRITISSSKYQC